MLRPSHPIRWAWRTWRRCRRELEERIGRDEYVHLVVLRVSRPSEAKRLARFLTHTADAPITGGALRA
jgi:hypothetical protein